MKRLKLLLYVIPVFVLTTIGQTQEKKTAKGIDTTTIEAWEKQGAEYGGWKEEIGGGASWEFGKPRMGIAAFRFTSDPKGKLPDAAVRYGVWFVPNAASDAGLKKLDGLTNINMLNLRGNKITDEGLKHLAGMKNLAILDLGETQVTDAGLNDLAGLTNMNALDLFRDNVTNVGLKQLARMKKLSYLNLAGTKVTDAGLNELVGLTNLTELNLKYTDVTDAGRSNLRRALPKCNIY